MKKKNNVTIWIICGVILVVLIAVIAVLIVNGTNTGGSSNNVIENNTNKIVEPTVKVTEQDIIEKYGVSKKDAEEIALTNFNSDNYECQTETTENYTYKVTVKDIIDESEYKFEVDPQTKTAFLIEK